MFRVLVIDDEEEKRADMSAALRRAGFEVDAVGSASAELTAAFSGDYDLAVIDLMLHGTNGFELTRHLRAASPDVRVVLTSDYAFNRHQLERINCGAVGFVSRPFDGAELYSFLSGGGLAPPCPLESRTGTA